MEEEEEEEEERDNEMGHLRVHGHGGVRVSDVLDCLSALENAYNSVLVLGVGLAVADPWLLWHLPWSAPPVAYGSPVLPEQAAVLVPADARLVLAGTRLQSPGFWDFLGKLNPLEVIRQYLNDRHERRKDREYRESLERERLELENELLANRVIADRIEMARRAGMTRQQLTPAINQLLLAPLRRLDQHQDLGIIVVAEFVRPNVSHPDQKTPTARRRR